MLQPMQMLGARTVMTTGSPGAGSAEGRKSTLPENSTLSSAVVPATRGGAVLRGRTTRHTMVRAMQCSRHEHRPDCRAYHYWLRSQHRG